MPQANAGKRNGKPDSYRIRRISGADAPAGGGVGVMRIRTGWSWGTSGFEGKRVRACEAFMAGAGNSQVRQNFNKTITRFMLIYLAVIL